MNAMREFLNSPAGIAVVGAVLVAVVDFATGVFAALRDKTFEAEALAAWLRKHLWGRVAPIATLLAAGYVAGLIPSSGAGDDNLVTLAQVALTGAGMLAAASYGAEAIASIRANVAPKTVELLPDVVDDFEDAGDAGAGGDRPVGVTLVAEIVADNPVPRD